MHIIVALLKAGKRVASFDLDSNQLTLSRYISNRGDWAREQKLRLELPDHTPITEEPLYGRGPSDPATLKQFISQFKRITRKSSHDFIIIDTPGGAQHLSLVAHGMADTLITPINDSLIDLDVLVAIEPMGREPRPSTYAAAVLRALQTRRKVCGLATDWVVVRNRLELVPSRNHGRITQVLHVIQDRLGFRTAGGLLERPVYRELFAAGLTAFDDVAGLTKGGEPGDELLARREVEDLIRDIGLICDFETTVGMALREIELATAETSLGASNRAK
jgi:chromosome partitioning protein